MGSVTVNLPANTRIGVQAITNAAWVQSLTIQPAGGQQVGPYTGSGTNNVYASTTFVTPSGSGSIATTVTITANGVSSQVSPPYQFVVQGVLNMILITSEDGGGLDWNDTILMLYWPVG